MKLRNQLQVFLTMFLLGTVTLLGGCATTGIDRSVKTANSIKDVDTEIRKMIVHINATGASLDSLVSAGNPDLKKSFDTYSKDVEKLDSEGKKVFKRIDQMKSRSKEYFAEWEKQGDTFTNPDIRELSDQRRNKLSDIYAQVPVAVEGIKGPYNEYMINMREIQLYLSNDLTPKGADAIAPVVKKTNQHREDLQESLKPLINALDEIKAELFRGKK